MVTSIVNNLNVMFDREMSMMTRYPSSTANNRSAYTSGEEYKGNLDLSQQGNIKYLSCTCHLPVDAETPFYIVLPTSGQYENVTKLLCQLHWSAHFISMRWHGIDYRSVLFLLMIYINCYRLINYLQ